MTFNPNAKLDSSRVDRRGSGSHRARNTGIALGGGGGLIVILGFVLNALGVNIPGLSAGDMGLLEPEQQNAQTVPVASCETGADANANADCRVIGAENSVRAYWADVFRASEIDGFREPTTVVYTGQTSSACGTASNAAGPFYCPADEGIYIDTAFYDILQQQFGASAGPLAEMYVYAHEYGHHIQQLLGTLSRSQDGQTGPESNLVRLELQADCFAGSWVANASQARDANGQTLIQPPSQSEIADALNAAAAVGDDSIQQRTTGQVNPESFSHGSSEQRQAWFERGYEGGPGQCDTFAATDLG